MAFVRAHSFQQANRTKADIDRIIAHSTEGKPERPDFAEDVAAFFSSPTADVSAHVVIDNNSIITCVRDEDIAFHALGDNEHTLGAEMCGQAGQSFKEWRDDYSDAVVENFAQWAAEKVKKYDIPMRWLTDAQVASRARGFATHRQVSNAFGSGIRSDPGTRFPYVKAMERIKEIVSGRVVSWNIDYAVERKPDGTWKRDVAKTNDVPDWVLGHPGAFQRAVVIIRPVRP